MARTTKKEVTDAFKRFLISINASMALSYEDVGAYQLSYNPIHGGYVIQKIVGRGGDVSLPFGYERRSAKDFVSTLNFAISLNNRAYLEA